MHIFTGDFFRKLWGPYAGWAQSVSVVLCSPPVLVICHNQRVLLFQVLFCSDLKKFQKLKEASHGEHCKIEDSEAEMRKEEPSIKTE